MYGTMNKIIFVSVLASLVVLPIFSNEVQATSYIGAYSDGYDDGKEEGADDALNDNGHNSQCPEGSGLTYCIGYKVGYEAGYISGNTIQ